MIIPFSVNKGMKLFWVSNQKELSSGLLFEVKDVTECQKSKLFAKDFF